MFNLFKKGGHKNLEWMEVDTHSHLLPGIDDGVQHVETAIDFIKQLIDLGLSQFVLTPHVFDEVFPNTLSSISSAHASLYEAMQLNGLEDVYTHSSAEYMLGEKFQLLLKEGEIRSFPFGHILVEMPWIAEPVYLDHILHGVFEKGYTPILAHPERYTFYFQRPGRYHELKEMGVLFQLNLLSPTGYYGKKVVAATNYLINNDLYDLIGTDLHHLKQLKKIRTYVKSGNAFKELGHMKINKGLL